MKLLRGLVGGSAALRVERFAGDTGAGLIGGDYYQLADSPNGEFTLAWRDAPEVGMVAGYRDSGPGRYLLIGGNRMLASGHLERPQDGHVADDGTFVLTDWHFGQGLKSTFCVFTSGGSSLLREFFPVNAASSAVAPDGSLAAVALLANSAEPTLSGALVMFDLRSGQRLWLAQPAYPCLALRFHADAAMLEVEIAPGHGLSIRAADGWADPAQIRAVRMAASPYMALDVVEGEISAGSGDPNGWQRELAALEPLFEAQPLLLARVTRRRAELAEAAGDSAGARALYERTLALDPAAGVRRRLTRLGGTPPTATAVPLAASDTRPYASTTCPWCGTALDPLPKAKKACPACTRPIYVRGGPDDRRYLLRKDQLAAHEAWWAQVLAARESERAF